jgi:hypothetical protein
MGRVMTSLIGGFGNYAVDRLMPIIIQIFAAIRMSDVQLV